MGSVTSRGPRLPYLEYAEIQVIDSQDSIATRSVPFRHSIDLYTLVAPPRIYLTTINER